MLFNMLAIDTTSENWKTIIIIIIIIIKRKKNGPSLILSLVVKNFLKFLNQE